jgi:O-antigen ligase
MTKLLPENMGFSWFFIALLGFVVVLPFSHALVSILGGVLLFTSLVEDSWQNKMARLKENRVHFYIAAIFLIYILSFLIFYKKGNSAYDLQKAMFFLVIPVSFVFGKRLSEKQKRMVFYAFGTAVFIASSIAVFKYFSNRGNEVLGVHHITFISHIRFSFQLILAFWFFVLLILQNKTTLTPKQKTGLAFLAVYFIGFLFFQQSLTGIFAFLSSVLFFLMYLIFQFQKKYKLILLSLLIALVFIPLGYVSWVVYSFYDIEKIDLPNIDYTTEQGNVYEHHFENKSVENGHYTYLFVCHDEMREEWNKRSDIKYDDLMPGNIPLYYTLIRYITSKGQRKDANAVKALTDQDIKNIESGMTNIIFQKKYSLHPRVYQTVWEYYMYTQTGNPNHQSLSQRIEFSKAAISIIKQNFWFGVGAGNWKEEFAKTYIKNKSQLSSDLYASSHNQYLNFMVKFGIVGLLLIFFLLIYPVVKTKAYRDTLFLVFIAFMFFANFADSNLESHMGSSFFVFFYCLFIITPDNSYLVISNKRLN